MNEITIPTNRTNRSIRQSCTGSPLSLMRCNCLIDDCTCRIDSRLFHLTNRTNRSIRQTCTGSPLSLMRCNCPMDDCTCRIDSKLFHLTNRTNRSNRIITQFSILLRCDLIINQFVCLFGWIDGTLSTSRLWNAIFRSTTNRMLFCRMESIRQYWTWVVLGHVGI